MRPCRVCGNTTKGQLDRHHLLMKQYREKGTQQLTMKLCAGRNGCRTHVLFHQGDLEAAQRIRSCMRREEIAWLTAIIGVRLVNEIYPR